MGILLKNGLIVTQNASDQIVNGDILLEADRIKAIGEKLPSGDHQVIDLNGLVVIPGFVQAHVHLCQTLFRNLADDLELLEWLQERIWPFEMAHDENSLRASAKSGLAEMLLGGVTCILDMGNARFQDVIFEEMENSGIRGFSGKVMMDSGDQSYKETTSQNLQSTEDLIKKWNGKSEDRIRYALAPRFVPSCSPELWEGVKSLAESFDLIIHTHSSENQKEWRIVKDSTGFTNIEFFVKNNLVSSKLCIAHCIWVSEIEIKMIADHDIRVLHCPTANLKLGSGIAPIPRFLSENITVGLGSDGAACNNNLDMFSEMRIAALIQKPQFGVQSTSAKSVFDMATRNGAKALGLNNLIGSLETGKKADLTILDLNKVHNVPSDNIYSQIVYSARASDVRHVMIDGSWVVKEGELINFESENIVQNSWEQVQKLFERLS